MPTGPVGAGPANLHLDGKEAAMIVITLTVTIALAFAISVTIRVKRK
jgi:N-acetylglucosamine kinase-like BadF-type ATPase